MCAAAASTISSGAGCHAAPVERARSHISMEHLLHLPRTPFAFSAGANHPCSHARNNHRSRLPPRLPVTRTLPAALSCSTWRQRAFHVEFQCSRHIFHKVFELTSMPTEQRLCTAASQQCRRCAMNHVTSLKYQQCPVHRHSPERSARALS
jgi:hypothetical protein